MNLRILSLAFVLCSATASFAADSPSPQPLTPPERAELLGRLQALHAQSSCLHADFTEERNSRLVKKPMLSSGKVAFQVPDKFRREVTGASPSLTVSNGKELWIYYPNFNEAERYTLGQRAMFDDALAALTAGLNFGRMETFYNLTAVQSEKGYQLTLTPKRSNLKRIVKELTVYLDQNLNVSRTDLTLPKGDQVITTYTNSRHSPLPPDTFDFTPPAGATISRPLGK